MIIEYTTFYQSTIPANAEIGDCWRNINNVNDFYRWSGTKWIKIKDNDALKDIIAKYYSGTSSL